VPTLPAEPVGETLGVDLGIVNLATASDGETCSGAAIEHTRQQMSTLRAALQQRGTKRTKRTKRHLKQWSGREARFCRATNHRIRKQIVAKATCSHKGLMLEDLRHIRSRTKRSVRTSYRHRQSSWAFFQLRTFIAYKAALALAGVPVRYVPPATPAVRVAGAGTVSRPTVCLKPSSFAGLAGSQRPPIGMLPSLSRGLPRQTAYRLAR
jgi:IS605 OrfB family transposase